MKAPSINLKRTLDITMKDVFIRLKQLNIVDSMALDEEYKEWIEASKGKTNQPHILYMNQIN
tara:strand:+ start:346 stop:531 length:186 start_codon:yes stop_codon:yes gene_type:complete